MLTRKKLHHRNIFSLSLGKCLYFEINTLSFPFMKKEKNKKVEHILRALRRGRKKVRCSHDSFFKMAFSDPKRVKKLLDLVLSKEEKKAYNLNAIRLEKDSHKKKFSDLVVSFPLKNSPDKRVELFIILEHKSYHDRGLFHQLLKYIILVRDHSIKQYGHPQPVIAVLFYHGKDPFKWKKTLQEEDFGSDLHKIPVQTRKNMLNYELKLINTKDPKMDKIFKERGSQIGGFLRLLNEIWTVKNPSSEKIKSIIKDYFGEILKTKTKQEVNELVIGIVEYIRDVAGLKWEEWKKAEAELIEERILQKGGVMNIRDIIKEKGREEGWEKGVKEGVKKGLEKGVKEGVKKGLEKGIKEGVEKGRHNIVFNMLKENMDISVISKVTNLSEKEIKKLKNSK